MFGGCRTDAWRAGASALLWGPLCLALAAEPPLRSQRFRYDAEASFAILGLPGVPTDLQLEADEHVTGFALGDTLQWMVEEIPGHVFVKPLKADLFTAGTLVTDRRSYQLTLRSGHPGDAWMQRVSWSYPALVTLRALPPALAAHEAEPVPALPNASAAEAASGPAMARAPAGSPGTRSGLAWPAAPGVDPVQLDFDYAIQGAAGFRPLAVFDDGHATWIRIPAGEALPVLYQDEAEGERLVHYAVRGDWLVAPRISGRWVLRLSQAEIRLQRHPAGSRRASAPPADFWR